MIREAQDVDEYAFALGALAHYAADNAGHPEAVNRSVALMFPKLRAQVRRLGHLRRVAGERTCIVEFSFDVVQVASGPYASEAYHEFHRVRGREAGARADVSGDLRPRDEGRVPRRGSGDRIVPARDQRTDSADHAHRVARQAGGSFEQLLPDVARAALRLQPLAAGVRAGLTARDYQQAWPARDGALACLYQAAAENRAAASAQVQSANAGGGGAVSRRASRTRASGIAPTLRDLGARRLNLANTNFDTGKPSAHGEYALADETYAELLDRLADRKFAGVPDALRQQHHRVLRCGAGPVSASKKERKRLDRRSAMQLAALKAQGLSRDTEGA